MDFVQGFFNCLLQVVQRDKLLFPVITADQNTLVFLDIFWPNLQTQRNTLHLILGKFPSGRIFTVIQFDAEFFLQTVIKLPRFFQYAFLVLGYRYNHNLDRRNFRRKHQAVIVAVHHNDGAYHAGGYAPGGLEGTLPVSYTHLAALLLGAESAVGVDIDPLAVKTAEENAASNQVADRFTGICGDLTEKVTGKYHVVAANIVADIVILLSQDAPWFMYENSVFIVSGIIDTREQDVLDVLQEQFQVVERREEKGWVAMALKLKTDC